MRDIVDNIKEVFSIVFSKIKFACIYVVKFELGRFMLGSGLMVIGAALSEDGVIGNLLEYNGGEVDNWSVVMSIGVVILLIQTIRFIGYAWIVHPIKALINKYKKYKKYKKYNK